MLANELDNVLYKSVDKLLPISMNIPLVKLIVSMMFEEIPPL